MYYRSVKNLTLALLAVSFLFGLTACGAVPGKDNSPSMVDYAYIPQSDNPTVLVPYNLESY